MKITMLFGSPHLDGTTNVLAENFIQGAQQAGHEVIRVDLARKKVAPCLACDFCRRSNRGCIQKDDMAEIAKSITESQLLVLVTPLYYYGMSAQLKAAIDRFYAFKSGNRKSVLLAACADGAKSSMDALETHYRVICDYLHWEDQGIVLALGCWQKEDILKTGYPQQAYELGKNIK